MRTKEHALCWPEQIFNTPPAPGPLQNVVMFLTLEEIKALLGVPRSKGGAPG